MEANMKRNNKSFYGGKLKRRKERKNKDRKPFREKEGIHE